MPDPGPFHDVIQIAGISDVREAGLLLDCGVRCLGFPLRLPVNAEEDLSETEAANVIRSIQPPGYGIAITYQDNADDIIEFMDFLGAPVVQLHGDIGFGELERIRQLCPALRVIKSLVVGCRGDDELVRTAQHLGPLVDAFITNTFDPATGTPRRTQIE